MKKTYLFILIFCCVFTLQAEKTVLWLTGLPCSGKSTLAKELHALVPQSVILDGDIVRRYVSSDLGFSKEDRKTQQIRTANLASLLLKSVDTVIVALVSPAKAVRDTVREMITREGYRFVEAYVNSSVEECINRDVKGMYAKALNGEIPNFTGISDPFDAPENPEIELDTENSTVDQCVKKLLHELKIVDPRVPHALFIGRWSPFHRGHWEIMKKVYEENPERPLMVFVRNTKNEHWSAQDRKTMVEAGLESIGVPATVQIIGDIDSVNWGRGVGYTPRMVDVDARIHAISGTKIRSCMNEGDTSWEDFVLPGVAEFLKSQQ